MSERGFASWTPEQRAEAQRKSAETRARKAEERRQKKAGRADRSPRRLPISIVQVRHGVHAVIVGIDAGLNYLAPDLWVSGYPDLGDRLTDKEIELLTEAFSDEAMKHPRVLRFLAQLTSVTDRMGIAGVLLMIALPRLARRGMMPTWATPILRDILGTMTEAEVPPTQPEPPPPPQNEEAGPDREAA